MAGVIIGFHDLWSGIPSRAHAGGLGPPDQEPDSPLHTETGDKDDG
jgi:hypothetical protein